MHILTVADDIAMYRERWDEVKDSESCNHIRPYCYCSYKRCNVCIDDAVLGYRGPSICACSKKNDYFRRRARLRALTAARPTHTRTHTRTHIVKTQ